MKIMYDNQKRNDFQVLDMMQDENGRICARFLIGKLRINLDIYYSF
jgi:hypothetical protein